MPEHLRIHKTSRYGIYKDGATGVKLVDFFSRHEVYCQGEDANDILLEIDFIIGKYDGEVLDQKLEELCKLYLDS